MSRSFHAWSRRIASGAPTHIAGHGAAVDGDGNVTIVGRFGDKLDLRELGGRVLEGLFGQVFLVRLDAHGNLRWYDRLAGAAGTCPPWSIAIARDGSCYLAGEADDGTWLVRLGASGQWLWRHNLSNMVAHARDRQPLGLAVDAEGNVLVFGHERTSAAGALTNVFLLKLDPDGMIFYCRRFACGGRGLRPRVVLDPSGGAIVSGYFQGSMAFGTSALENLALWDLYVAKLDRDGAHVWSKRLAGGRPSSGFGVAVDRAGNVTLGGAFQPEREAGAQPNDGSRALSLVSFDPDGKPRWTSRYLGDEQSRCEASLDAGTDGSVLLAGAFEGTLAVGEFLLRSPPDRESLFVAKVSADGKPVWGHSFGRLHDHYGITVHAAPEGGMRVVGSFAGLVDFGGEPVWSEGPRLDVFVSRLSEAGEVRLALARE